jgi:hypothetical protein
VIIDPIIWNCKVIGGYTFNPLIVIAFRTFIIRNASDNILFEEAN